MKRTSIIASIAVLALGAASIAVAKGLDDAKSVSAVAGSFTATTASKVQTRTCTTTDGKTLVTSNGTYTGTASGDADLTGPITIRAFSTINTTDNVGVVSGTLKIDTASSRDSQAQFSAVYSGGSLAGLATGHAHDPYMRLVGNLSAGFSSAGGFTSGKIGGGTAGGAAVEVGPGRCKPSKTVKQHSSARGTVSAVSSTSITVAGLTCVVPSSLASKVATLKVNDRAEIDCALDSTGANVLVHVDARR